MFFWIFGWKQFWHNSAEREREKFSHFIHSPDDDGMTFVTYDIVLSWIIYIYNRHIYLNNILWLFNRNLQNAAWFIPFFFCHSFFVFVFVSVSTFSFYFLHIWSLFLFSRTIPFIIFLENIWFYSVNRFCKCFLGVDAVFVINKMIVVVVVVVSVNISFCIRQFFRFSIIK